MNEKIIPIGGGDFTVVRSDRQTLAKRAEGGKTPDTAKPRTDGKVTVHPNPGNLTIVAEEKR